MNARFLAPMVCIALGAFGKPTLFVNEDAWCFFATRPACEMNVDGLRAHVDRLVSGGHVTHVAFCVNGMRTAYPSKVNEPLWRTVLSDGTVLEDKVNRHRDFFDRGIDPFRTMIDRCRERGVSPWVSMRINDVHHITTSNPKASCAFWRAHPELRRYPDENPATSKRFWTAFAYNYAKPEVRDFQFAIFREIADRYDVDGYELDTLRFWEHFTPGRAREEAHFLTEFILRCRAYTRELAARRGHPIRLSARTPSGYDASRGFGYDPEAWVRTDAIDLLVVCNFFNCVDFECDFADWRRRIAAANPKVEVLPGATDCFACEACRLDAAAYRGWADQMYAQGAAGLYLYNASYLPAETKADVFGHGLSPARVAAAERRFPRTYRDCVPEGQRTCRLLPVPPDRAHAFPVVAGRGARPGDRVRVTLGLGGDGAPPPAVTLNGVACAVDPVRGGPSNGVHGTDRHVKTVWHYEFPSTALKPGENLVGVAPVPAPKGLLFWVEIAVSRLHELRRLYNGYRFWTFEGENVYNPVSINLDLAKPSSEFRCRWAQTGRASSPMNMLKRGDMTDWVPTLGVSLLENDFERFFFDKILLISPLISA